MQQKNTGLSFDATNVQPASVSDPIPAGWYPCEITDCEVIPTKGPGKGTRVKFEYTVLSGDYKGRKFFGSINNKNANAQAQEIGQKELSAICHATGVIVVSDTAQFVGKMISVKVKVKAADGEYDASNEPRAWKPMEGAPAAGFIPGVPGATPPPFAVVPGLPAVPAAPVAVVAFPPQGWLPHPTAAGYFYAGNECLPEAELRARFAPVVAVAPVAVVAPVIPQVPVAPVIPAAPVAAFPPDGWIPHPQSPGFYYTATGQVMSEADLRASIPAAVPAVPAAPAIPAAPVAPAIPAIPTAPAAGGEAPPWARQAQ